MQHTVQVQVSDQEQYLISLTPNNKRYSTRRKNHASVDVNSTNRANQNINVLIKITRRETGDCRAHAAFPSAQLNPKAPAQHQQIIFDMDVMVDGDEVAQILSSEMRAAIERKQLQQQIDAASIPIGGESWLYDLSFAALPGKGSLRCTPPRQSNCGSGSSWSQSGIAKQSGTTASVCILCSEVIAKQQPVQPTETSLPDPSIQSKGAAQVNYICELCLKCSKKCVNV